MGKATATTHNGNALTLVQLQTLQGSGGVAAMATVQGAVATHNKTAKGTPHVVAPVTVAPPNTKGMQWQLALLATLARNHGVVMVRLSYHGGSVALCGPAAAVAAVQAAYPVAVNAAGTACANAYNPAAHGNRVSFTNAFMCGYPAGLATTPTALAYGIGYLYTFGAPTNAAAYAMGTAVARATAKTAKPAKTAPAKTAPAKTAQAAPTAGNAAAPTAGNAAA